MSRAAIVGNVAVHDHDHDHVDDYVHDHADSRSERVNAATADRADFGGSDLSSPSDRSHSGRFGASESRAAQRPSWQRQRPPQSSVP